MRRSRRGRGGGGAHAQPGTTGRSSHGKPTNEMQKVQKELKEVRRELNKLRSESNGYKTYIDKRKKAATNEAKQKALRNYNKARPDEKLKAIIEKMRSKENGEELVTEAKNEFKYHLNAVYGQYMRAGLKETEKKKDSDTENHKESVVGTYDENGNYVDSGLLGSLCTSVMKSGSIQGAMGSNFNGNLIVGPNTERKGPYDPVSKRRADPVKIFYNLVSQMATLYAFTMKEKGLIDYGNLEVFQSSMPQEITPGNGEESAEPEKPSESVDDGAAAVPEGAQEGEKTEADGEPGGAKGEGQGLEKETDSSMFMGSQLRQMQARLSQL